MWGKSKIPVLISVYNLVTPVRFGAHIERPMPAVLLQKPIDGRTESLLLYVVKKIQIRYEWSSQYLIKTTCFKKSAHCDSLNNLHKVNGGLKLKFIGDFRGYLIVFYYFSLGGKLHICFFRHNPMAQFAKKTLKMCRKEFWKFYCK